MKDIVTFNPTRVCAWCGLIMHIGVMKDKTSHGICALCLAKVEGA